MSVRLRIVWTDLISRLHGKNDLAEGLKILLDTDLKIILLDRQNNFVGIILFEK